ncbi:hypothetical protein [Neorhodopirellula lusitana]|uniref:hypothetical protein n=1 Tax=Neorhodopirellula lusitana TaxID=445327 RepID=UPI0024B6EC6C|nr:hypothetical protein [Neorhodopirellula lusitana]
MKTRQTHLTPPITPTENAKANTTRVQVDDWKATSLRCETNRDQPIANEMPPAKANANGSQSNPMQSFQ